MRQMVAWNIYLHENNKISMPLHVGKYASHTWSMWDMFVFLLFLYTLLGKSQIAGWKMLDPDWLSRCNFPIEHGKIAAIAMLVYQGGACPQQRKCHPLKLAKLRSYRVYCFFNISYTDDGVFLWLRVFSRKALWESYVWGYTNLTSFLFVWV